MHQLPQQQGLRLLAFDCHDLLFACDASTSTTTRITTYVDRDESAMI